MTKTDYKNFEKEKIQALQQKIDKLEEKIKFLESKKDNSTVSKGNTSRTPMIKFESPNVASLLKGADAAMKRYSQRLKVQAKKYSKD